MTGDFLGPARIDSLRAGGHERFEHAVSSLLKPPIAHGEAREMIQGWRRPVKRRETTCMRQARAKPRLTESASAEPDPPSCRIDAHNADPDRLPLAHDFAGMARLRVSDLGNMQ